MDAAVKLVELDGKEAKFELNEKDKKQTFKLAKGEDLAKIHPAISDLKIDKMNKTVVLSNGLELKTGAVINPYSYSQTVQDAMMQRAVAEHFKLERALLAERAPQPKIKPLTLFFIDDIAGYRSGNELSGSLKDKFESWIRAEATHRLETERDPFYRDYLQKTLDDVSACHGGYFPKTIQTATIESSRKLMKFCTIRKNCCLWTTRAALFFPNGRCAKAGTIPTFSRFANCVPAVARLPSCKKLDAACACR